MLGPKFSGCRFLGAKYQIPTFCPWAIRPALRCPAAGKGPRGRQRRSSEKVSPLIMFIDAPCRIVGHKRGSGQSEGTFVDTRSVCTTLYTGLFFSGQNPKIRLKSQEK